MSQDVCVNGAVTAVRGAVLAALAPSADRPLVMAVSGGRDSVVLLDAVLAVARARVRGLATFDHGTGAAARDAARYAERLGHAAGVRVWVGRVPDHAATAATEAAWRAARWDFLHATAREAAPSGDRGALVATGHTADDRLETVVLRALRDAGPRGLAGMASDTPQIVRPLLGVSGDAVAAYADARGLAWVDDPSNASLAHLRNRVRHRLLPALRRARPEFTSALGVAAGHAARWRIEVDAEVDVLLGVSCDPRGDGVSVPVCRVAGYDEATLAMLWPAIAARAGVTLDRRGTARLAAFTMRCVRTWNAGQVPAGEVPVAGGVVVALERTSDSAERVMVLRRPVRQASLDPVPTVALTPNALAAGVRFGRWHLAAERTAADDDPWSVRLDAERRYVVRSWRPGDRLRSRVDGPARRVKRFFADRHVPAAARVGWPVVVAHANDAVDAADGEVVWIPGVRRAPAAPARPGAPGLDVHCRYLSP